MTRLTDYHAHVVYATREAGHAFLVQQFELMNEPFVGNPDVSVIERDILSIGDAREIRRLAQERPLGAGNRYIIVEALGIGHEAQEALLKALEEPGERVILVLVVSPTEHLRPTVRSRVREHWVSDTDERDYTEAREFLTSPLPKRFEYITKLLDDNGEESGEASVHEKTLQFIDALEAVLFERISKDVAQLLPGLIHDAFDALHQARTLLSGRGPMRKLILEYIACAVPAHDEL